MCGALDSHVVSHIRGGGGCVGGLLVSCYLVAAPRSALYLFIANIILRNIISIMDTGS